jgi:hypothetical protein
VINKYKNEAADIKERLTPAFNKYVEFKVDARRVLEFLEFVDPSFYNAFMPPENEGMTIIGEKGKRVDSNSLYDLWSRGREQPNYFKIDCSEDSHRVWSMNTPSRQAYIHTWSHQILMTRYSRKTSLSQLIFFLKFLANHGP